MVQSMSNILIIEYDSLKSYGSDSTKYNSASSGGKKQDIKI